MKVGRNDPCPCGSGKKYKACCLPRAGGSTEFLYQKLSDAYERLTSRLDDIIRKTLGEPLLTASLADFLLWSEDKDQFEKDAHEHPMLYVPWLLFNWIPDPQDFDRPLPIPLNTTIAEMMLNDPKANLDPLERKIAQTAVSRPHSFYEVQDCRPGKGFRLSDVFLGEEYDVSERSGSKQAQRGDLIFARVIQVDAIAMLAGTGAMLFPPSYKTEVIRFRQMVQKNTGRPTITAKDLDDCADELRGLFFNLYRRMITPPQMQNTDGHALVFHRVHYTIDSAQEAFDALKSLCATESPKQILSEAERDAAGRIRKIEFNWSRKGHKQVQGLKNTILGRIRIEDRSLKIEVNSAERAAQIRREVEARLPGRARYRTTEIISPEAYNEHFAASARAGGSAALDEQLLKSPELQSEITRVFERQWASWINTKIPALGGKTPQQAIKTPDGRESVAALLAQAERNAAGFPQMPEAAIEAIRKTRLKLGLS
jgi:hypothetical protein